MDTAVTPHSSPLTPHLVTELVAELLPVTSIRPSQSAAQKLRRARYNAEQLLALAANVGQVGVMQPILVRPITGVDRTSHLNREVGAKYEIVAGERRWLAADRAGLAHVPAIIRDLTDADAVTLQLTENIQRESIHPLEEAEGFHELMQAKKINADALGDLLGKSRSYVYARLKLRDLCPDARDALQAGTLDASKALLLARLKSPKLQAKALKLITETNWRGEQVSYKEAFAKLRDKFMVNLATAPFALSDATFFVVEKRERIDMPPCTTCPHCSANDTDLQRDIGDAHMCTDAPCFEAKVKIHWDRKRREAEAAGRNILTGDEAKQLVPGPYDQGIKNGYIDLDAPCEDIEFDEPEPEAKDDAEADSPEFQKRCGEWDERQQAFTPPSYRQVLGDSAPQSILVQAPGGKLVELVPVKDTVKALKAKGVKPDSWRYKQEPSTDDNEAPKSAAERKAEEEKRQQAEQIEKTYRRRVFDAVWCKWKGPLKRPDLERLAEFVRLGEPYEDGTEILTAAYGKKLVVRDMKDDELVRAIFLWPAALEADSSYGKPGALLELAQRFKIDAKKIRADVAAELKPKPATAEKPDAPQPKAAAKPAKKKAAKK